MSGFEDSGALREARGWLERGRGARIPLLVASLVVMLLIGAGAAGSIWRYEVALRDSDLALASRVDALRTANASTAFWRERETMNEYLLNPAPRLLAELAEGRSDFDAATALIAGDDRLERELVLLSRSGNA